MSKEKQDDEVASFSLIKIDTSGITEPGKLLIERVSDALGGIFAPWQKRRIAEADADVALTAAQTEIRITDVQRRAVRRWLAEEERQQVNMETVLNKAAPLVGLNARPEKIEEDWLSNFLEKSRLTSDDELQTLWAKILAGEANAPGKFGKRTVNLIASLDKSDAELFKNLCRFSWIGIAGGVGAPLILDAQEKIVTDNGVSWSSLKHLDEIGLVSFESLAGFISKKPDIPVNAANWFHSLFMLGYGGRTCMVKPQKNQLQIGQVKFSKAGAELAQICNEPPIVGYFEHILGHLKEKGAIVHESIVGEKIKATDFFPDGFPSDSKTDIA